MNAGPTSDRVHAAITQQILTRTFHPGQRLDPAVLADALSSSITPIRDALHRLVGQGLVETATSEGFHVPHLDAPALQDLYGWTLDVLTLAIRSWPRTGPYRPAALDTPTGDPAEDFAMLAAAIARRSANAEHGRAIQALNARLHPLRTIEGGVLEPVDGELNHLAAAFADHDRRLLQRRLVAYHRRRQRKAGDIVRAHYRA